MKVRIAFTVEIDKKDLPDVLKLARQAGLDFDNPPDRLLLHRLIRDQGRDAITYARERVT